MIEALITGLNVIHFACLKVGIDRTTHYKWMENDPDYAAKVQEISEVCLDFVESKLLENIKNGNQQAIQYYLSRKGRSRGYFSDAEAEQKAIEMPQILVVVQNNTLPELFTEEAEILQTYQIEAKK